MKITRTPEYSLLTYCVAAWFTLVLFLILPILAAKTMDAGQGIEVTRGHLSVHQPVSAGDCSVCHSGVSFETINLEAKTCTGCHQKYDSVNTAGEPKSGHGEFECMDCHEPHSSDYRAHLAAC